MQLMHKFFYTMIHKHCKSFIIIKYILVYQYSKIIRTFNKIIYLFSRNAFDKSCLPLRQFYFINFLD